MNFVVTEFKSNDLRLSLIICLTPSVAAEWYVPETVNMLPSTAKGLAEMIKVKL